MFFQVTVSCEAFVIVIAVITIDFVSMAYHILGTISFTTTIGGSMIVAVRVFQTALMTIKEVRTLLLRTAS